MLGKYHALSNPFYYLPHTVCILTKTFRLRSQNQRHTTNNKRGNRFQQIRSAWQTRGQPNWWQGQGSVDAASCLPSPLLNDRPFCCMLNNLFWRKKIISLLPLLGICRCLRPVSTPLSGDLRLLLTLAMIGIFRLFASRSLTRVPRYYPSSPPHSTP